MSPTIPFDFDAAVGAPFRMQPGLRRLAAGSAQLTPLAPGSRHQREKLAVLGAFAGDALCAAPGFEPGPALAALFEHAAAEWPAQWRHEAGTGRVVAAQQAVAVGSDGAVERLASGVFGNGDELSRCLQALPAGWRRAALFALSFAEDIAFVDGASGTIPWLAVCLPSHWSPPEKVGRPFAEVHAPVADNQLLLQASASLMKLVTGGERWERFVWNVTDHPRLHTHPARLPETRWHDTGVAGAWFRSERQTFIPVPDRGQAVFTIAVDVQPLARVLHDATRARRLHAAIASMSPAVLAYRGLGGVRDELLAWIEARARPAAGESGAER